MPVILAGAQTINEGPLAILEYLLHQAAHGLLATTGHHPGGDGKHYPDEHSQGNAGRYHNKSYRDAAQSLGLKAAWTQGGTGWSATPASDDLAMVYEGPVRQIVAATADWQPPSPLPHSVRKSGGNGVSARCQCQPPRAIRMRGADLSLREDPVICSVCGKPPAAAWPGAGHAGEARRGAAPARRVSHPKAIGSRRTGRGRICWMNSPGSPGSPGSRAASRRRTAGVSPVPGC